MRRTNAILKPLLAVAGLAATPAFTPAWAAGAAPALDLQPGLWEIRLTVRTSGRPPMPPEVLAKLTPQERARIEAKAKERAAEGPQTTVKKSCLHESDLLQPLMLTFGGEGQGCRQTVVEASPTRQQIKVQCGKGAPMGGGTIQIEAVDPKNAKVTSQWFATDGSRSLKMSSTATLKWLGAICELEMPAAPRGPGTVAAAPVPAKSAAPQDAAFYDKLGREQTARNDLQAALQSLTRAIELDSRRPTSYNARGFVYLRLKNYANAITDFSEAIRLRPDYANAYHNRAIARRLSGDAPAAAGDQQKATELTDRR